MGWWPAWKRTPLTAGGQPPSRPVSFACGLIAFPQAGPPLAWSMPIPVLETGSAAPVAG